MKDPEYYMDGPGKGYHRFYLDSRSRLLDHVYGTYVEVAEEREKMKVNIPKRALMIKRISDDIVLLPQLPLVLWREIAEYEGGVGSSLLGKTNNNNEIDPWTCCIIL